MSTETLVRVVRVFDAFLFVASLGLLVWAVMQARGMYRWHREFARSRERCVTCDHARQQHTNYPPCLCNVHRCPCMRFEGP